MNVNDTEQLAAQLEEHPDYRVLRRLDTSRTVAALEGPTVRRAAIVDTETTGTDPAADKVIELAVVVFEYCHATGVVGRVLGSYDGLEDPGVPIPPSSTAIHGITDAMVAGRRIDDAAVATLLQGVGLVIAHNRYDGARAESSSTFSAVTGAPSCSNGRRSTSSSARQSISARCPS